MKELPLISIVFMLVTACFFSGCNSPSDTEKNKFVGTWNYSGNDTVRWGNYLTFFSNGSVDLDYQGIYGIYEIKDGKLAFKYALNGNQSQLLFGYSFSDDGNKMTLMDNMGNSGTFEKEFE
jgi:hypothetical protein